MKHDISTIVKHYLICALWASIDEIDEPLDINYNLLDITANLRMKAHKDVEIFVELAGNMLDDWTDEQIGHDLFLTRNGCGTAFWDRDLPFIKDELAKLCGFRTKFDEFDIYITDRGEIDY